MALATKVAIAMHPARIRRLPSTTVPRTPIQRTRTATSTPGSADITM